MLINPLPEDTVRLLGSATVITTPVGLVKELLENAIDAGATSIDILVSKNMVDRIEVRDNGSGIHPDDYECLGRAGHTSKLASYDELRTIGATTLGFRGQALASANSMGNVTIITRTLQEPIAVRLELRHGFGGIENQEHTSAPVGSTVSVTALFRRLPVRQQVVLKEAQKNIVNTKHLLHAYALARPQIRLSFKVLGGNPKQSWSYSPRPQATVKEAVVQVFGTGLMSQCLLQTLATEVGTENDVCHDGSELAIEAILPKPDADLSRLSKGPFLSIDSRPITTLRGTGRNLINIFRTQFKKLRRLDDVPKALNDTFLRVNIKCSPGAYDPNIEPSKDQVIFANESQVTNLFKCLCTDVYNAQGTRSAFVTIEKRPLIRREQTRTPPPSSDGPQDDELEFVVDMSADPEMSSDEETEMLASRFRELQDKNGQLGEHSEHSKEGLNPWVIAKMTAPTQQSIAKDDISAQVTPCLGHGHDPAIVPGIGQASEEELPILRPRGLGGPPGDLDPPPTTRTGILQMKRREAQDCQQLNPTANVGLSRAFASPADYDIPGPPIQSVKSSDRHTLPDLKGHCNDAEDVDSDGFVQSKLSFVRPRATQKKRHPQPQMHINDVPARPNRPFRKPRRLNAGSHHLSAGQDIRNSVSPGSTYTDTRYHNEYPGSPMRNNPLVQVSSTPSRVPFRSPGSHLAQHPHTQNLNTGNVGDRRLDEDPREYLIRRQRSESEHRGQPRQTIKRTMTDRLPLATIPQGYETQHLVLIVKPDMKKLGRNQKRVTGETVVNNGSLCAELDLEDVAEIEARLRHVLSAWAGHTLGEEAE
ncbi:hypothetical protein VMCG_01057 [Cytospora schulzeri]|uniref:DNA mismatch repair protein S5 domain-containing protein n=1 Tax=Cytospora schulzeri TaxID=448051 RepID=A0A423X5F4_9PEZI|nr:hypothetical protein VMCG_01057 [Valsa malicola]